MTTVGASDSSVDNAALQCPSASNSIRTPIDSSKLLTEESSSHGSNGASASMPPAGAISIAVSQLELSVPEIETPVMRLSSKIADASPLRRSHRAANPLGIAFVAPSDVTKSVSTASDFSAAEARPDTTTTSDDPNV